MQAERYDSRFFDGVGLIGLSWRLLALAALLVYRMSSLDGHRVLSSSYVLDFGCIAAFGMGDDVAKGGRVALESSPTRLQC